MKDKVKSAAKAPAKSARAPKRAVKAEKPAAKKTATGSVAKPAGAGRETRATAGLEADAKSAKKTRAVNPTAKAAKPAAAALKKAAETARARTKTEKPGPRTKKPAVKTAGLKGRTKTTEAAPGASLYRAGEPVVDPIGDTTDGEGWRYLGEQNVGDEFQAGGNTANAEVDAFRKETRIEASDAGLAAGPGMEAAQAAMETSARNEAVEMAAGANLDDREQGGAEKQDPGKLERLQKILSQAGIASRRRAEEMITEGRVMVNGQVVTTLGSKANPGRDHIRVDGKLLRGAERHRYFLLNKPRGFVTTVSDPEGRPTVMKFFEKMHERVYPVGRLDYQSEGLLLMTNDGELANLLTKAGSGVEKTYLVKVAGRPTEEELGRLRAGVTIERGEAGSGRVLTAPARVRQVRVGDNPWFEVVLIEGRNRELRKMFGAVGHFVEKIRRVGYGPLVLDLEPGKMRELTPDEVKVLRLTAEGKMKPKRLHADRMLPKDAGLTAEKRMEKRGGRRDLGRRDFERREGAGPRRNESGSFEKRERRDFGKRDGGGFGRREGGGFGKRAGGGFAGRESKPFQPRSEREPAREGPPRTGEFRGKRVEGANRGERGGFGERRGGRPFSGPKPRFERQGFGGGPRREREGGGAGGERKPFREGGGRTFDRGERKPFRAHGERPYFKQGAGQREQREHAPGLKIERDSRKSWGAKPERRRNDGPRGEFREPRPAAPAFRDAGTDRPAGAPAFRGQGGKFAGRKPGFSGRPGGRNPGSGGRPGGFGGPRREGGRGGSGRPSGGRGFGGRKRG